VGMNPRFPITKKYLQNLMNRCIRGLACPEESKVGDHTYEAASADKCETDSPLILVGLSTRLWAVKMITAEVYTSQGFRQIDRKLFFPALRFLI
jgi:hypothetical protein